MRSGTMNLSSGGAYNAYRWSFGELPPGTVYKDSLGFTGSRGIPSLKSIDVRPDLAKRHSVHLKALSTTSGGVGTAGQAMVPVFLDPLLVDQERRETPMREIIPRVSNLGITADWNERTARDRGAALLEDASLSDNSNTYDRLSKSIKYYYAVGRTTGPAQASIPSGTFQGYEGNAYSNAKQLEVAAQTANLAQGTEIDIINGNPGGTYAAANTDTGYDAESVYAAANTGIKSQLSDENQDDQAGAAIDLDSINDLINLCWEDGGRPSLLLTDGRTVTDIKALMVQSLRLAPSMEAAWGFETTVFNGPRGALPLIQSQFVRTDAGDGSGTIYGSKSILALDMAMIENRVLQDTTYEPLAKTNDSDKFMIKEYFCTVVRGVNTTDTTSFHGSIIDIA